MLYHWAQAEGNDEIAIYLYFISLTLIRRASFSLSGLSCYCLVLLQTCWIYICCLVYVVDGEYVRCFLMYWILLIKWCRQLELIERGPPLHLFCRLVKSLALGTELPWWLAFSVPISNSSCKRRREIFLHHKWNSFSVCITHGSEKYFEEVGLADVAFVYVDSWSSCAVS